MTTTPDTFTNYATSTVAGGAGGIGSNLAAGDTTLFVQSGDGAKYPSVAPFMLQLGIVAPFELARCTSRSGDVLTIVRGQEGTSAATWAVGVTVEQVATAGNLANLWAAINSGRAFLITDYGAKCDGATDDKAAWQAAITACQNAGGGTVVHPGGNSIISDTLTISADNVHIQGVGWASEITAKNGWTSGHYLLQIQGPGGSGNFRYGIAISEVFFNGNSVAGVNGIDLISTYAALLDHIRMRYILGINVEWDGISGAFGAYNYMRNCFITDGGATAIGVQTNNSEWLTIQGGHIGYFQSGGSNTSVGIQIQNLNCVIQGVQFDYNDIAVQVKFAGRTSIVGCQFDRGWTYFVYLNDTQNNVVADCFFGVHETGALQLIFVDGAGNNGNLIEGCTVEAGSGWAHFINEGSGIGGSNLYANNDVGGLPLFLLTGVARGNKGYNPYESLATPAAPTVANATTGGTVAAGTYGVEVTLVSASGETAASASSSTTTTTATSTITISSPTQAGNASGWYAYVTQAGGATYTRQQTAGSPTPFGESLTLTAPPSSGGAAAPGSNTTADVTTPAVPATTVAVQNTTGVDVTVYVAGGTVSAITIGGKATGLTSGAVRLPARQTIALTYSVAPSWTWIGE